MQAQPIQDLFLIRTLRSLAAARVPFADGFMEWASHLQPGRVAESAMLAGDLLRRGRSVSDALREAAFPASTGMVRLLEGLERNPQPVEFLGAIEKQLLEEEDTRRKLREVIVYPAVVFVGMSIAIVIFGMTMMEAIYEKGWEHQRPVLFLLYSALHPLRPLLILLIPAAAIIAYRCLKDPMFLPLPGLKRLALESQRATFCQFLQLEFASRSTVTEALEAAAASFSPVFQDELRRAATISSEGLPLEEDHGRLLAPQIRYFINRSGAGEELIAALQKLKQFYREQTQLHAIALQRSAEVAGLIVMGVVVGLVVIECFNFYYGYVVGKFPF